MSEAERIKSVRIALKLTQEEFSKILGVTKQYVSLVENSKCDLSKDKLIKLFLDYKINLHWLLTGEGSMFLSDSPEGNIMKVKVPKGTKLLVEYEE